MVAARHGLKLVHVCAGVKLGVRDHVEDFGKDCLPAFGATTHGALINAGDCSSSLRRRVDNLSTFLGGFPVPRLGVEFQVYRLPPRGLTSPVGRRQYPEATR